MKILMLCDFFEETLEYQENLLVKYYVKHGFDVTVVTSTLDSVFDYYSDRHDVNKRSRQYVVNGAKIIKQQYSRVLLDSKLRWFKPISSILNEERPDLIYVHDVMLNLPEVVRYIKSHSHCKLIMDYHADYSNSGKNWASRKILHGLIRKRLYLDPARKHMKKIFPVVPAGFRFLNEIYKVPMSEMELLPLGGDYDRAQSVRSAVNVVDKRKSLGIDASAFVIFTGGKLNEQKRTDILVDVVARMAADDNIHLLVAGKAESENFEMTLRNAAKGKAYIHFLGWLRSDEIYSLMAISDVAVFPASQSILWQQAICMHLPLVVGDTGDQSIDYLNLHRNIVSLVGNEINPDRLYSEVRTLYADKGKRSIMGIGAAKTASEHLDWNKLIYKTLQFNIPYVN